jgi:hypothetical protein
VLAKPVLYALWRKPLQSGTYFGVAAQLLLSSTAEYLLVSHNGVRHLVSSKCVVYMTTTEASTDIGHFLDGRRNFFNTFSLKSSFKLPSLKQSTSWYIFARNRIGERSTQTGSNVPISIF